MFKKGLITPFWEDKHRYLNYRRAAFNNPTDVDRWRSQGYTHINFTGELYDMKNVMPEWADPFFKIFDGINVGVSFYRMNTCEILPMHCDTYETYINVHNISDPSKIQRAVIFLEDWQSGHLLEVDGTPIVDWKKGDYIMWDYNTPHMAANIGTDPRYTLQITFTDV